MEHRNTTQAGNARTTPVEVTIGLDMGDRYSHYCVLRDGEEIVAEDRVRTTPKALREVFDELSRGRVALEVGGHSRWASRLLEELGHEVLVANPRQLPMIYASTKKCDRTDAETLARLARFDPALLAPIRHRGVQAHADLTLLRSRDVLVRSRTQLINHVRGTVKAFGHRLPSCSADCFHTKAAEHLPEEVRPGLRAVLETIKHLTQQIRKFERSLSKLLEEKHPEGQRLTQVAGVGLLTALAFVLTLEDPKRFARRRSVGAFIGLTPRKDESGDSKPQLGISKAGDAYLRHLLVACAHYILGRNGPDCDLKRWGQELCERGGKNAKKKAVVATARKLAVLLLALWANGKTYEPLRQAQGRDGEVKES